MSIVFAGIVLTVEHDSDQGDVGQLGGPAASLRKFTLAHCTQG